MKFRMLLPIALVSLAACEPVQTLEEYRPVTDPARTNAKKYERDLADCRAIAIKVRDEYQKRQGEELAANLLIGLLAGAAVGAVAGNNTSYQGDLIAYGAASGMAAGAASGDYTHDLVTYGPRRVVDRCMDKRGHDILTDPGKA